MKNEERKSTGLLRSADKLRFLILNNPNLPLLVFAGENANTGDFDYMCCSSLDPYVGEFLDCTQTVNSYMCYTDREVFEEDLANSIGDSHCSDEEIDTIAREKAAEYSRYWKPCIIVNVNNV